MHLGVECHSVDNFLSRFVAKMCVCVRKEREIERGRENVSKCKQLLNLGGGLRGGHSTYSFNFCICLKKFVTKGWGKLFISDVLCFMSCL